LRKYSHQEVIAGGTFALYSLLCRHAKVGLLPIDRNGNGVMHYEEETPSKIKVESRAWRAIAKHKSSHYLMLCLALFGSCMTIGEGVLTPALSGSALQITFVEGVSCALQNVLKIVIKSNV
jgi:hypothetical protein